MIEAITASASNAQLMRAVAEEVASSQSLSANPERIQKAAIGTPYLSHHVRLSPNTKPIFVIRDTDTGTQIKQFPTEAQIRAYHKAGQAKSQVQTSSQTSEGQGITPEQAKILVESSVEFKEERAAVQYEAQFASPGQDQEAAAFTPEFRAPVQMTVDQQA